MVRPTELRGLGWLLWPYCCQVLGIRAKDCWVSRKFAGKKRVDEQTRTSDLLITSELVNVCMPEALRAPAISRPLRRCDLQSEHAVEPPLLTRQRVQNVRQYPRVGFYDVLAAPLEPLQLGAPTPGYGRAPRTWSRALPKS